MAYLEVDDDEHATNFFRNMYIRIYSDLNCTQLNMHITCNFLRLVVDSPYTINQNDLEYSVCLTFERKFLNLCSTDVVLRTVLHKAKHF
jgi:hypothetical protein